MEGSAAVAGGRPMLVLDQGQQPELELGQISGQLIVKNRTKLVRKHMQVNVIVSIDFPDDVLPFALTSTLTVTHCFLVFVPRQNTW